MKESTTTLVKTTTLHHEQKIGCLSFPYSTRKNAFPKIELCYEGNLTHAIFSSIKRTNTFPWNILHHEVNKTTSIPKNIVAPLRKSNACQHSFYHEGNHKHKCIVKAYVAPWRKAHTWFLYLYLKGKHFIVSLITHEQPHCQN